MATYLKDAGMEVIYTPPWQELQSVIKLTVEEDVDVIGISSLATDHLLVPELMELLRENALGHVQVAVGGIVPDDEHDILTAAGVGCIFGPGASREDIVAGVTDLALDSRAKGREKDEVLS